MNRTMLRAWSACMLLSVLPCSAIAQQADRGSLTLRDAIALASERSPTLVALAAESDAARHQARSQALSPPTTFEAQFENFGGTGTVAAARALETTLQLSHVVEFAGKERLRAAVGANEVDRVEAGNLAKRADLLAEVARRFVRVLADQERLAASGRATSLAEYSRDAVQARIKAGAASPILLSRAEISLARARIDEEHAEHELASSRVALASLWGERHAHFAAVRGDLYSLPSLEPLATYQQRLEANPEVLAVAAESRVLDSRLRLARAQRTPNITFNAGVRRLEALDDQAFVAGFSVPLGAAARAQPELSMLNAQRAHLNLTGQARLLELNATLFELYQELSHTRVEAHALRGDIRPQAQRVVRATDEGYRAGRFSLIELADAQRQLLEIERDAIRAASEFHTWLIDLERLTGASLHALATGETR